VCVGECVGASKVVTDRIQDAWQEKELCHINKGELVLDKDGVGEVGEDDQSTWHTAFPAME
jgi:hypothetical protein